MERLSHCELEKFDDIYSGNNWIQRGTVFRHYYSIMKKRTSFLEVKIKKLPVQKIGAQNSCYRQHSWDSDSVVLVEIKLLYVYRTYFQMRSGWRAKRPERINLME
jgi:hypothetical protein